VETEYARVIASSAEPEGRILASVSLDMGQLLEEGTVALRAAARKKLLGG